MRKGLKEYLNKEHIEGSDLFLAFMYKQEYMYYIMNMLENRTGSNCLSYGYGNYNASICFLYDDIETERELTSKIRSILEKLKIDPFSVYITYINKSGSEKDDLQLLMNEVKLIKPRLIYYFYRNNSFLDNIIKMYEKSGEPWPTSYMISKDNLFNSDDKDKKTVSSKLSKMIAFKDILQR